MSDPSSAKWERESRQVRSYLDYRGIAHVRLERGNDPPDVIVHRDDKPPIAIEVVEYHPENDRVGAEYRWSQFRKVLDDLIKEQAVLKGVSVSLVFHDKCIPGSRRSKEIAESIVSCVEYALGQGLLGSERCKLSFLDDVSSGCSHRISPNWLALPKQDWPILAEYVGVLSVSRFPWNIYLPSNSLKVQGAWCSPYPEAFLAVLKRKEEKVLKAIQDGKYSKGDGPLWLLIVSNVPNDLSSFVFGDEDWEEVIKESGFSLEGSIFDRVWLTTESGGGRAQCLCPWDEQIAEG